MKIKVNAEGYCITIPLSIGDITNGFTMSILESYLKKYVHVPFTEEQLYALSKELKQAKEMFPNLTLIDIQTADGQSVSFNYLPAHS